MTNVCIYYKIKYIYIVMFYGNMFFLNISVPMLQAMYTEHLDIITYANILFCASLVQYKYIYYQPTHIYIDLNVLVATADLCQNVV